MARYLSGIKKQLQDVSDLLRMRYGKGSEIAEESIRTLASVARLERRFLQVNGQQQMQEELAVVNER